MTHRVAGLLVLTLALAARACAFAPAGAVPGAPWGVGRGIAWLSAPPFPASGAQRSMQGSRGVSMEVFGVRRQLKSSFKRGTARLQRGLRMVRNKRYESAFKPEEFVPPFIASIDQGTQSSRVLIFDREGRVLSKRNQEHEQIKERPGWCEHDPEEIFLRVKQCIDASVKDLERAGFAKGDVEAVGITNQRETSLVWSKATGRPLFNAIVWLDTRTQETVDAMIKEHGSPEAFVEKCGLPISTYFSATKWKWMIDNVPEVREAVESGDAMFGTVDSWLLYKLTGEHATDVTNAARTMLMNIKTCSWDEDMCKAFGIPMECLPNIRSSAEVFGTIQYPTLKGVPLAACLGDQQAALVGHCAFTKGMGKSTFGTGCFFLLNTGHDPVISQNGLLSTVAYQLGPDAKPVYALEGSVAIAGAGMSWLVDNLSILTDASESERVARTVRDTAGVYLVPAFTGLFAPHWRGDARGVIVGLTQYTQSAHIVRAMIEAVCFQVVEVVGAMEADSGLELSEVKVDGGMTQNTLMLQTQADLLDAQVLKPEMVEVTAFGAALAAGLAVGVFEDEEELVAVSKKCNSYEAFSPENTEEDRTHRMSRWKLAIEKSLGWEAS
eukprot:CAMPEP_0173464800 /NCGR_PEP_ID=MMETSP1357-20121228/70522_1 /TAXON_ID=77926 /ORGANISM="Hemiselmis rufescens, Strain PCC563" /LENGTH=608 /DNA_ID=CAMNT_0014432731 /DNA_START=71 /DNA_END=1897 /DNA_ORIENTATION=-